jgi:hypothetical protein
MTIKFCRPTSPYLSGTLPSPPVLGLLHRRTFVESAVEGTDSRMESSAHTLNERGRSSPPAKRYSTLDKRDARTRIRIHTNTALKQVRGGGNFEVRKQRSLPCFYWYVSETQLSSRDLLWRRTLTNARIVHRRFRNCNCNVYFQFFKCLLHKQSGARIQIRLVFIALS